MPSEKFHGDKSEKFVSDLLPEQGILAGGLKVNEIIKRTIKYLVEGLAVALAAFYIPRKKMDPQEILMIAITASAIFAVLDMYSPTIAQGARHGAGFGIGMGMV